jgi:ribonuclease BN (tRNA processing enzyme)
MPPRAGAINLCLEVTFLGTGSSSHPSRSQSSMLISVNDNLKIIVDMGCNSYNFLKRLGFTYKDIDLFIFTHTHYDHLCGLPLMLFSESFKGSPFIKVIADDITWNNIISLVSVLLRTGIKFKPVLDRIASAPSLLRLGNVFIESFPVKHTVKACGVEITSNDFKVVISGDTSPIEELRKRARGSTLTAHEATLPSGTDPITQIKEGHTSVDEAVKIVMESERGVLYHLSEASEKDAIVYASSYSGKVIVPDDLTKIKIC